MVKKLKVKCLLAGLIVFVAGGVNVNAESFNVKNEKNLREAVCNAKSNDTIVLDNNITLSKSLNIDKSIVLDLNEKTVIVSGNNSSIVVGKKEKKSKKDRVLNVLKLKFREKDKFNYDDTMNVVIKNGTITHSNGLRGRNGVQNSWLDYCGNDGTSPSETIQLESGKLVLSKIFVYAGNGGNGGDASYQALAHVVFGGGAGGKGGMAGNGGDAIKQLRKECVLELDKDVVLRAGKSGRPGKDSTANPNYWVYRGRELHVSADRINGQEVNKVFEKK